MTLRQSFAAGLAVFAAWMVFRGAAARAQGTQGPIAPKPGATIQKAPEHAIRVRVALVNAPVAVTDAKGALVLNLEKKDFHVFDDGILQNIESFDLGGEPLSAVLMFETSSRIAPLLPAVQKSAIVFTQTVVGPSGDAAVLAYNDDVEHLLDFTVDHDKIEKTIGSLQTGTSGARHLRGPAAQPPAFPPARHHRCWRSTGLRQRRKTRRGPARGAAFEHCHLRRGTFDDCRRVAITAAANRPDPGYAAGHVRIAPDSRHPADADERAATVQRHRSPGLGGVGRAECQGRSRSSSRSRRRGTG